MPIAVPRKGVPPYSDADRAIEAVSTAAHPRPASMPAHLLLVSTLFLPRGKKRPADKLHLKAQTDPSKTAVTRSLGIQSACFHCQIECNLCLQGNKHHHFSLDSI